MGKKNKRLLEVPEEVKPPQNDGELTWEEPTAAAWPTAKTHRWETECGRYRVTRIESTIRSDKDKEPPGYFAVEHRRDRLAQFAVLPDPKEPGNTHAKRFRSLRGALEAAERLHRDKTNVGRLTSNADETVMLAEKTGLDGFGGSEEAQEPSNVLTRVLMKNEALASARLDGETQVIGPTDEQIKELRGRHPGMILLFKVGDDYLITGEDRETVGKVLECGSLAGFDSGKLEGNLRKLLAAGHRVAICDEWFSEKSEKPEEIACPPASEGYNNDRTPNQPEGKNMTETEAMEQALDLADAKTETTKQADAPLRVSPQEAIELFREAGWHNAKASKENWQGKELVKRIEKIIEFDDKQWEPVVSPRGKALLTELLAAVTAGRKIELIEDEGDENVSDATTETPAKRGRPKGSKNKASTNGKGEPKAPRNAEGDSLDPLGCRRGTNRALANSLFAASDEPMKMPEIIKKAKLTSSVSTHVADLMERGLLKKTPEGYLMTERGRKAMGKN